MATSVSSDKTRLSRIIAAMRPRQWAKNGLVLMAPLAAGVLFEPSALRAVALALASFTLASSAVYLLNDVLDVEADRRHPTKSRRPIAAGEVSVRRALTVSAICLGLALGMAAAVNLDLFITVGSYLALQTSYARWLKHVTVIDIAIVSSGFLLRAIAGGVAAEVPLSQWFLLVAAFGSLFVVAGKRYSELLTLGTSSGTRRSLDGYSETYLRFVWTLAATVSVTAYALWAFEIGASEKINWQAISIAPFVLGLLRYAVDVDRGLAGEPEEAVVRDRVLQVLGVVWVAVFALGVYTA